ncbi:MAG: diguanylate cyclase/phosphodiesterase [Acidobacteria bacterium OLB17]|nr:MAG: diguanylate cyclase/phosphodiesterase [Acidobacteria bacterium OLB17]MCZ2391444.1 PAS domain S-box protein [Acidobacteriota bacterium]
MTETKENSQLVGVDTRSAANLPIIAADDGVFRQFIENLPAMFYAVTPTPPHKPIFISRSFERFGYPLEDWLTKPDIWDIVTHPEDRSKILATTRESIVHGESTDLLYRVICADGSIAWIRDRGCIIKDKNGEPVCWQGVIIDMTPQMEAETEIRRREQLYRAFARSIPDTGVLIFDHELRYRLAEGPQIKSRSWTAEMFEGRTVFDVFPGDEGKLWADRYKKALAGETVTWQDHTSDGLFETTILPIRDENGTIFSGMVIWQDIAGRVQSEERLRESEARYRELFENASDIIYVHDLEGNYTSINKAGEAVFGYSREEALQLNLSQVIHPDHFAITKEAFLKKTSGETSKTVYEVDCLRKDGERITLEINSSLAYKDGTPVAVQGIARDITNRRRSEEALRRSEANLAAAQRIAHLGSWELELKDGINSTANLINWSDEVYRIFGYEPRSVKPTIDFIYRAIRPSDRAIFSEGFVSAIKGRLPFDIEARIVLRTGEERLLKVQAETVGGPDGRTERMFGTIQDITESRYAEEALRESEARFRDLFENANDIIYTHDLDGNLTSVNRAVELVSGYSSEELVGMNYVDVVAPDFLDIASNMTPRRSEHDKPTMYEIEIVAKDGHRVTLEVSTRLIYQDGVAVGVQGLGRDITQKRIAEKKIHETLSLFTSTFESTADGIVVMSLDRQIVTYNKKFVDMWELASEPMEPDDAGKMIAHICDKLQEPDAFLADLDHLYGDPLLATDTIVRLKDGRIYERYSQPQLTDGLPVGRVCCFRDITERTLAEERLRFYALHDPLTELPNRAAFMKHLRDAVAKSERSEYAQFAVLFLDLDRFKVINDSLGHTIGDKLLIAVAEKLTSGVRPGDIVARLGGDEFTILLQRSGDIQEVSKIAERLQAKISEPFKLDNYEVFTTASIGIVLSGQMHRSAEDFLRDADIAMYRAKEGGKARFEIFDQELHVRNMNLLRIETDLRHALEKDQFEVHYQPIVDLESGTVNEFEALIRWRHPEHGLVGPEEFVHVAEETGLIVPMGKWILNEACRQVSLWQRDSNRLLAISVNLSAKQLMHPTLTAQVRDAIMHSGLRPSQVKLEVTESTVMEHSDKALKVLKELRRLGVGLSTDDFGTGYSSLSYLQKFPFQRLKIDRSFVKAMDDDDRSSLIVKTILMLGENLDLEVVAEGIETSGQRQKLRELKCGLGQGYLFSPPVPAARAKDLLRRGFAFIVREEQRAAELAEVIELCDLQ